MSVKPKTGSTGTTEKETVIIPEFSKKAKQLITAPIPQSLIKERDGGRGMTLSYLSGSTVIDYLNAAFNYLWDMEIIKIWKEESVEKQPSKWDKQKGINDPVPQNPVAHAIVKLTVYMPQADGSVLPITKMGTGSKSVIGGQSEQESIFKAATTDALKKAASYFGIGLELYRDEDEQAIFDEMNFEDPWTDEAMEVHKESIDFVQSVMKDYGLNADDMGGYVQEFSGGELTVFAEIVPENIDAFTEFLKAKIDAANKKEETEE